MKKLWGITIFGIIFVFLLIIWIFVIGFSSNQSGAFFNKAHNAIWLGHEWVGEKKEDKEIQKLVNNLDMYKIDTVFVHSGPFAEDGTIAPEVYKYAVEFLEKARSFNDEIQYQAWVGQVRKKIDLADDNVVHNIANQCMILGQMVDFDGIHFDIEPVWDGDTDFIKVLSACREVLPAEKKISVALAEFIPESLIWLIDRVHSFKNYNSEVNYKNVAEFADQIVVMAYDTSMNHDWFYKWFVKEQVIWLTDLLEDKEVFVGIPAYEEEKDSFNPQVENIENALEGLIKGLNNFRSDVDNFAGVAIYSYWEMQEDEWRVYNDLWLE